MARRRPPTCQGTKPAKTSTSSQGPRTRVVLDPASLVERTSSRQESQPRRSVGGALRVPGGGLPTRRSGTRARASRRSRSCPSRAGRSAPRTDVLPAHPARTDGIAARSRGSRSRLAEISAAPNTITRRSRAIASARKAWRASPVSRFSSSTSHSARSSAKPTTPSLNPYRRGSGTGPSRTQTTATMTGPPSEVRRSRSASGPSTSAVRAISPRPCQCRSLNAASASSTDAHSQPNCSQPSSSNRYDDHPVIDKIVPRTATRATPAAAG